MLPVCYGGEFGLDLAAVGAAHGLTCDEVVALHSGVEYLVSAIGFIPGFPYLRGLPEQLHTPRRKSRARGCRPDRLQSEEPRPASIPLKFRADGA